MGEQLKRPSEEGAESGQRKKHRDNWQHYEVSGEFNACMDNPEAKKDGSDSKNGEEDGKICIDGNLKGDAHVNSKGLIVGEAEVHNSYNDIDVNFEMQANRKHKNKRDPPGRGRSQSPQGPSAPNQDSSESDQTPPHSSKPEPRQEQTPSASEDKSNAGSASSGGDNGGASTTNQTSNEDESEKLEYSSSSTESSKKDEDSRSSSSSTTNSGNGNNNEPINLSSTQVNQAPFIQKLYAMLEDPKLQHVIRWAPSHDRFYINPNEEFSQMLCLYFKHTNISSFVRQLSMYGFHKVANAGHNRDKWYPWEFRHMDGAFRRGDIESLRNIKRRSTRQIAGKRVKYVTLVNGSTEGVKQEPSPTYAQPLPHGQVPSQQQPLTQTGSVPNGTAGPGGHAVHANGHSHHGHPGHPTAGHPGHPRPGHPHPHQALMYGQDPTALAAGGGMQDSDQTMRLLRMHQSMQSQLLMVQETVSRLSQNVGEMGVVIDQLVSRPYGAMIGPAPPPTGPGANGAATSTAPGAPAMPAPGGPVPAAPAPTPHHMLPQPLETPGGTSSSTQYMSMSEGDRSVLPNSHPNGPNGHPSGPNGHPNGHVNGHSNGPNGHLNGHSHTNGHSGMLPNGVHPSPTLGKTHTPPQPLAPQPLPPQIQDDAQHRFGLRTLLN